MNIKLKRKLSFILLCVFCLSSFGFSTYASEHWAQDIASKLADKGIVNGYADGSFGLDNNILRAEFVSIINRAFGFLPFQEKILLTCRKINGILMICISGKLRDM